MQALKRSTFVGVVLLGLAILLASVVGVPYTVVRTADGLGCFLLSYKQLLHPDGDRRSVLFLKGRKFTNLRGNPPFYLNVPDSRQVVFVTHRSHSSGQALMHILDVNTGRDITVDVTRIGFGWHLCSGRRPGEQFTDYITTASHDSLVITTRGLDWACSTLVSLTDRALVTSRVEYFDAVGYVTNSVLIYHQR